MDNFKPTAFERAVWAARWLVRERHVRREMQGNLATSAADLLPALRVVQSLPGGDGSVSVVAPPVTGPLAGSHGWSP